MNIDSVNSSLVLSKNECNHIIAQSARQPVGEAEVFYRSGLSGDSGIRSASVTDVTSEAMREFVFGLFKKMNPLKIEFSAIEPIQLIRYDKGDHYKWHTDWSPNNNKKRKLSMTVQLSDPAEYTGGDVVILDGPEQRTLRREIGVATVFPSWAAHMVSPVESGVRFAMVAWATGKPFK
jgi:predicted 2-oxoglutarate/Fe(II)-dependent dioxygenase YbiX